MQRVGVVHSGEAAATIPQILRASRERFEPVFIFPEGYATDALVRVASRVGECREGPVARLERPRGLDALLTFDDDLLEVTDVLAQRWKLPRQPGHGWDKLAVRSALRDAGLSRVRALDASRVNQTGIEWGMPVYVKPRRGAQGRHVARFEDSNTLRSSLRSSDTSDLMVEEEIVGRPMSPAWLGDFVSVEVVSTGDEHHVVAMFSKLPVRAVTSGTTKKLVVTGDIYPTLLSGALADQVATLVQNAHHALRVRWRLTHTEVKLTPHGPEIIEVNGRLGGDLQRVLDACSGPDLVRVALGAAVGELTDWGTPTAEPSRWACGIYPPFSTLAGQVRSRVTRRDLEPVINLKAVDHLATQDEPRSEASGRCADLVLGATSASELLRSIQDTGRLLGQLYAADHIVPVDASCEPSDAIAACQR